jgi:ribonuclease D
LILRTKGRLDDLSLIHGIRGTGNLDPTQLGVMGALFLWRDAKARALDRPCGSIISNERLVKIARALDANVARRYVGLQARSLHTHTPGALNLARARIGLVMQVRPTPRG